MKPSFNEDFQKYAKLAEVSLAKVSSEIAVDRLFLQKFDKTIDGFAESVTRDTVRQQLLVRHENGGQENKDKRMSRANGCPLFFCPESRHLAITISRDNKSQGEINAKLPSTHFLLHVIDCVRKFKALRPCDYKTIALVEHSINSKQDLTRIALNRPTVL